MNVAIIGEGVVSAIGCSAGDVYESLVHGHSGIGVMHHLRSAHKELPVGEVPFSNDEMKSILGIASGEEISRTVLMGIWAVRQAVSGLETALEGCRTVLVSGTTVAGMDITEKYLLDKENTESGFMRYHDCGRSSQQIAAYFKFFGEVRTISTACSSAANALMAGAEMLKAGEADAVVAGGTEALSLFHLNGFNSLMILDKERCRPFDATRAGLNLGEGAGFLVLVSEETAARLGRQPKAWLSGYGNKCDAYHLTASSENGQGAYLSMVEAIEMAGLKPSDIDYVNAHGTGTPNNDSSESVSLKRVFGENIPPFSSTKAFTGHTTSASGGIEAVISLLAIEKNFIPGNLGWSNPMEEGLVPDQGTMDIKIDHVLSNSFAFGGNDSSLVFSRYPSSCHCQGPQTSDIEVLAEVEVSSGKQLEEIGNYIKPLEARRMNKLMKAAMLSSLKALDLAGVESPDAIVAATEYGCLENTWILLEQMREGEGLLKPSCFMQSTHNAIAGNIAIKTRCNGYNITYSQAERSFALAIADARRLLRSGKYRTVLVGIHDEAVESFSSLLDREGLSHPESVKSTSILLSCRK